MTITVGKIERMDLMAWIVLDAMNCSLEGTWVYILLLLIYFIFFYFR